MIGERQWIVLKNEKVPRRRWLMRWVLSVYGLGQPSYRELTFGVELGSRSISLKVCFYFSITAKYCGLVKYNNEKFSQETSYWVQSIR